MITNREHFGSAVLDSLIYCATGRQVGRDGGSIPVFEAYSPASDTWYKLPDVPTNRSGVATVAANGRIYVLGGEWPGVFDIVEEYDPMTGEWTVAPPMQDKRHGFVAVTYSNTIYIMGANKEMAVFYPRENPNYVGLVGRTFSGHLKRRLSIYSLAPR